MKAVGYARVSTHMQSAKQLSETFQKERIASYCDAMSIELVTIFDDSGKSGKDMTNREELQKALLMLKRKEADTIIVYKIDRLSRSLTDLAMLIKKIEKWGCHLISIQDSISTNTASGRLMINLIGSISQWEAEAIAEKTQQAMSVLKTRGHRYSRHIPYGVDLADDGKTLTPNKHEQQTINSMKTMRASGMTYQTISDRLNSDNIKTKYSAKWHPASVRNIINHA